jgi:hypothetical protein
VCHRQGIGPQIHVLHIGKGGSTQACSQSLASYRIVFNFSRQLDRQPPGLKHSPEHRHCDDVGICSRVDNNVILVQHPQRYLAHSNHAVPGPSNYRPLPSVGVDPVVMPVRPVVLHDHDMVLDDNENVAPPNPLSDVSYPLITAYCSRAQARDEDLVQLGEESDLSLGPVPLTTVWATCTLVNARAHICLPLMAADAPPPHALIRARHDVTRLTSPVLGRVPLSRNARSYSLKTVCTGHHSAGAGRAAALAPIGNHLKIRVMAQAGGAPPIHLPA